MECEMIERARQSLRAVDIGRPLRRHAGHLFRTHERHQAAVAGVEEDVLDLALAGRFDNVRPRTSPAQFGGVELDRAIDIESGQPQMMDARAFHSRASCPPEPIY